MLHVNDGGMVEVTIPTTRTSNSADFTLITIHCTSKEESTFTSTSATVGTYTVQAAFEFGDDLKPGQYEYVLSDDDGELQRGLMQVDMAEADVVFYESDINIVTYEQH